ncbi:MAG: aromatic ring-hydroxylating dioxygenase subunit alpha [Stappiaceae bacterium]
MTGSTIVDEWYPVGMVSGLEPETATSTVLMGEELSLMKETDSSITVRRGTEERPALVRFGHVWTSLGSPDHPLFSIPEADNAERRLVDCGCVRVKCSPLRAVENFLDIAHFPFIHTGILGVEDHPEVKKYDVEVDEKLNEIWAKKVEFYQPQAAASAQGGIITKYMYRVATPTVSILYKTCPVRKGEWDIITLFVQPVAEDVCDVWPWMALYDDDTPLTDLIHFQQMIFLQDRSILENQIPRLLPLDPKLEIPTRADLTSIAYRRWLKRRHYTYGAQTVAA